MRKLILIFLFSVSLGAQNKPAVNENIPHLEKHGSAIQIIVKGKPLLMFGGETGNSSAGIGSMEEGKFVDGKWIPGLRMNGDQDNQGRQMDLPGNTFSIQKVLLYKYK